MARTITMVTGVDHMFSSGMLDCMSVAVEERGSMEGVIGSKVEVIWMVLLLIYPFIQGLGDVLFQSLALLS